MDLVAMKNVTSTKRLMRKTHVYALALSLFLYPVKYSFILLFAREFLLLDLCKLHIFIHGITINIIIRITRNKAVQHDIILIFETLIPSAGIRIISDMFDKVMYIKTSISNLKYRLKANNRDIFFVILTTLGLFLLRSLTKIHIKYAMM